MRILSLGVGGPLFSELMQEKEKATLSRPQTNFG
jgi:hypothetical protein